MNFEFLKKNDAHLLFEEYLSKQSMGTVYGGEGDTCSPVKPIMPCNPWLNCDAWNCLPDCICVSNFA